MLICWRPAIAPTPTGQQAFNQFRVLLGYGQPNKRGFSGATNLGFDTNLGFLQYAAVQTAYNWDCCGFSIEVSPLCPGVGPQRESVSL